MNSNLEKYKMIAIGMDNSKIVNTLKCNNLQRDVDTIQNILYKKVLYNKKESILFKLLKSISMEKGGNKYVK